MNVFCSGKLIYHTKFKKTLCHIKLTDTLHLRKVMHFTMFIHAYNRCLKSYRFQAEKPLFLNSFCLETTLLANLYSETRQDHKIFRKVSNAKGHPLLSIMPRVKPSSYNLGKETCFNPKINTMHFKNSFINRLAFKYELAM